MKEFYSILFTLFFYSCNTNTKNIVGTYESKQFSDIGQLLKTKGKGGSFFIGTTLSLNADSTFFMQTCGNNIKGNWMVKDDSLHLEYTENKFRKERLNDERSIRQNGLISFQIQNAKLKSVDRNSEKYFIVEVLEKKN